MLLPAYSHDDALASLAAISAAACESYSAAADLLESDPVLAESLAGYDCDHPGLPFDPSASFDSLGGMLGFWFRESPADACAMLNSARVAIGMLRDSAI